MSSTQFNPFAPTSFQSPSQLSQPAFGTPEQQQQQQAPSAPNSIEPLHQGNMNNSNGLAQPVNGGANADLEYQRQLLAKKLTEKSTNFASPTDQMMSPCSKLLAAHKNKKFGKVGKPKLLSQAFNQAAAKKEKENREIENGGAQAPIF